MGGGGESRTSEIDFVKEIMNNKFIVNYEISYSTVTDVYRYILDFHTISKPIQSSCDSSPCPYSPDIIH